MAERRMVDTLMVDKFIVDTLTVDTHNVHTHNEHTHTGHNHGGHTIVDTLMLDIWTDVSERRRTTHSWWSQLETHQRQANKRHFNLLCCLWSGRGDSN